MSDLGLDRSESETAQLTRLDESMERTQMYLVVEKARRQVNNWMDKQPVGCLRDDDRKMLECFLDYCRLFLARPDFKFEVYNEALERVEQIMNPDPVIEQPDLDDARLRAIGRFIDYLQVRLVRGRVDPQAFDELIGEMHAIMGSVNSPRHLPLAV